ncbi:MAG: hypothetical protein ABWY48_00465 [Pseudoxanthomonas sp.]
MSNTDDLQELALRLSAFADVLNQHATRVAQEAGHSSQLLRETAEGFAARSQRTAQELVETVGRQAREAIERHAAEGLRQSDDRLKGAAIRVESATGSLYQQLQLLGAAQRSLVWKSGLALLAGSLLAVGGSGYLVWKNQQALKRAEFSNDMAEAMRTGALTRCDGAICARVGAKPKRFGDKGEYARVE